MDLSWVLLAGCAWGQIISTAPAADFIISTAPVVSPSTGPALSTGPLQGAATAFPIPFQFDPAFQPRSVPAGYNQPGAPFSAPLPSFTPAPGASFGSPASTPQGPPTQPAPPSQPPPAFQQPPPAFQQPAAPTQPGASP